VPKEPEVFGDEIPTLRKISEEDWALIENIVELSMVTGDIYGRNATITAERLVQLVEMPAAAVQSLVGHLAYLRTADLVDALDHANTVVPLVAGLLQRNEQARQQHERQQRQEQQSASCQAQRAAREDAWQEAQADPAATLQRLQQLEQTTDEDERLQAQCELLGIGGRGLSDEGKRRRLQERIGSLLIAAPSEPSPPSPRELLIADARQGAAEARRPTTMATLRAWEQRNPHGDPGSDWRRFFYRASDFVQGRQAAELIARAVGAVVAEVIAHAGAIAARDELSRLQIAEAYTSADELLSDALEVGAWEWLGARLGVPPHLLEARLVELLPPEG